MRTPVLTLALMVLPSAAAAQGAVSSVTAAAATDGSGTVFTIRGSNPCGAVRIDFGDGTSSTVTVRALPAAITHTYLKSGTFRVRVTGVSGCAGVATTTTAGTAVATAQDRAVGQLRFRVMDTNRDGRITRDEWRGSPQSFQVHDWNGDGELSGDELRSGATRQRTDDADFLPNVYTLNDWSARRFTQLDHDNDGRISPAEWHFDFETFLRVDRDRNGHLSRAEFLDTAMDDDRGDRFDDLDLNGDGRVDGTEWHGTADAFEWLDRNGDGVLTRTEVVGDEPKSDDQFASLDVNRDGAVSLMEWHWSRTSFTRLDRNGDGRLTRAEYGAAAPAVPGGPGATIAVAANVRWTDTGIYVQRGDTVSISAAGTVRLIGEGDVASPQGTLNPRPAPRGAPLPDAPAGLLVARIGSGAALAVGASRTWTATDAGRLYLAVNDDHLGDNHGTYQVTVRLTRDAGAPGTTSGAR
jgi:Ca2+-binding EF-hand superfamily protein